MVYSLYSMPDIHEMPTSIRVAEIILFIYVRERMLDWRGYKSTVQRANTNDTAWTVIIFMVKSDDVMKVF